MSGAHHELCNTGDSKLCCRSPCRAAGGRLLGISVPTSRLGSVAALKRAVSSVVVIITMKDDKLWHANR